MIWAMVMPVLLVIRACVRPIWIDCERKVYMPHGLLQGASVLANPGGTCLTGRHYIRCGINHANLGRLPAEEVILPALLREHGWRTGHFGKWHLGTLDPTYSGKPNRDPARNYAPPWERGYDRSLATEFAVPTWDPSRAYDKATHERGDEPWSSPYYRDGIRIGESVLGCDSKFIMDACCEFTGVTRATIFCYGVVSCATCPSSGRARISRALR